MLTTITALALAHAECHFPKITYGDNEVRLVAKVPFFGMNTWGDAKLNRFPDRFTGKDTRLYVRPDNAVIPAGTLITIHSTDCNMDLLTMNTKCGTCSDAYNGNLRPILLSSGWRCKPCGGQFTLGTDPTSYYLQGFHRFLPKGQGVSFTTGAPLQHFGIFVKQGADNCYGISETVCNSRETCRYRPTTGCQSNWCPLPVNPMPQSTCACVPQ